MSELEKERKVFEKWVKKQCPQIQWELKNKTDGEYDSGSMSWAWEAWSYKQAEIDTLKEKLAKVESEKKLIMSELSEGIEKALEKIKPTINKIESGEFVIMPKTPTMNICNQLSSNVENAKLIYQAVIEASNAPYSENQL